MDQLISWLKLSFLYDLIYPIIQIFQIIIWILNKKNSLPPHYIKQKFIKSLQKKYQLTTLIETGTYLGTTVNTTKDSFKKIYSIELDKRLYLRAKNKFKKYPKIKIINGDSGKVLVKLLKEIKIPCLFWLDAHYSKGITSKGTKNTPIMKELYTILSSKIKKHVILIDDADSFNGKDDYPSIKYLKKFIKNSKRNFSIKNNIILITS